MLADQVGYLRPQTLTGDKISEVSKTIANLQSKGAQKLVLDLRGCGAGDPDLGVDLANLFLDHGLIAYAQGQRFKRVDFNADPKKQITKLPLVVITNRGTATGAEVAASALGGDKRAEVVGERTYGDASIRRTITMDDGAAVILSVAKFYGPDGKAIQDNGVTPSTLVAEPDSQADLDEDGEPVASPTETKSAGDLLLDKALEVLKKS